MAETVVLPDHRVTTIVCGTAVRKNLTTLAAHLESLNWQELPKNVRLIPVFVPDFLPEQADAAQHLFQWVNERSGHLLEGVLSNAGDFSDAPHLQNHHWQASSMARVGANKNKILAWALAHKADYVFLCDADVILDRTTLASLLASDKPLVTGVYWTRWQASVPENARNDAGPQVWIHHPYQMEGRGMDGAEFRQKLLDRELTRVWGFGACTLIQRRVLEAGISFDFLPDVPMQGLMAGEDRHFSIRCERQHIDAYADNWPDAFHIYHGADVAKIPAMLARLGAPHPDTPRRGDLVSLRLRALEPLPVGPGRVQHTPPHALRGRVGSLAVLPELEEAVAGLRRGETAVVRVHFPVHYPLPVLRGRTRLIEVKLLDVKPFGFPPVVEDDLYVGPKSGAFIPPTTVNAIPEEVFHG